MIASNIVLSKWNKSTRINSCAYCAVEKCAVYTVARGILGPYRERGVLFLFHTHKTKYHKDQFSLLLPNTVIGLVTVAKSEGNQFPDQLKMKKG